MIHANRLLVLLPLVLAVPLSRGAAQTCAGTAAFRDGRLRLGAFYQSNHDIYDGGFNVAVGIPQSLYFNITLDARGDFPTPPPPGDPDPGFGGAQWPEMGAGIEFGYQIYVADTPLEFCPAVMWHAASNPNSYQVSERGFGGSVGYRFPVSTQLALVPAAGVRWVTTTRCCLASPAYNDVSVVMGLVFHKTLTLQSGLLARSQSGSKIIYTLTLSTNRLK